MKDVIKYNNFIGSVHFSPEDEVFYGKIEGIDDLVTFEGDSVKELKAAFIDAVNDYIELCETVKKSPFKSYKGSFNVRVNPSIHKQVAYKSLKLGLSLNQFVEQAVSEKLEKYNP